MNFERLYTLNNVNNINWIKKDIELHSESGDLISIQHDIEVPDFWSDLATSILANKYLKRSEIPSEVITIPENDMFEKYYRSIPKPGCNFGEEKSLKQVVHRLVGNWTYWLIKSKLCTTVEDADIFYDELSYILIHQIAAPNSPQFFNTGLGWAYGIPNNDSNYYYYSEELNKVVSVKESDSNDVICRQLAHACFIQSINDSLLDEGGIYDTLVDEAKIFKKGSGSGINFSSLRGKNEKISGGGTSSGLISFLKTFDRSANDLRSGGTLRRAAKAVLLDIDHPEIFEFLDWKNKEEEKVESMITGSQINNLLLNELIQLWNKLGSKASVDNKEIKSLISKCLKNKITQNYILKAIDLAKQGFTNFDFIKLDTNFNGNAYQTISGQNSNNMVVLSDEFLNKVKNSENWNLINRTDKEIAKTVNAKLLFDKIIYSLWNNADPGIHFSDTINSWNTCANEEKIKACNPCSEYIFLDDTACNLGSIKLTSFYNYETDTFDIKKFSHVIKLFTIVLETTITSAILPTKNIAERTYNYRTLGLGFTDLSALIMRMGISYDSKKANTIFGVLSAILTGEAYLTSTLIAKDLGAFKNYDVNKSSMNIVLQNHKNALYDSSKYIDLNIYPKGIDKNECSEYLLHYAKQIWNTLDTNINLYGIRNAQVTAIAPTGTIGLLMDCDTTGIEPDFSLIKYKKMSDGGYVKIINNSVSIALQKLQYSEEQINNIINYIVGYKQLPLYFIKKYGLNDKHVSLINSELLKNNSLSSIFNKEELQFIKCDCNDLSLNYYIYGHQAVEGAPHLNQNHYAIFDCAVSSGIGKRYITISAHINALASVQPFISGGISKTINMPISATIKDVEKCFWEVYNAGIKAFTLYRDGSKLSQPLNTFKFETNEINETNTIVRNHLPLIRNGKTHEFKIGNQLGNNYHKIYLRTGEYDNKKLGEIFIDYAEENGFARTIINTLARSISIGLQYGIPLNEYTTLLRSITQEPNGHVVHPNVKVGKSIFDVIGKILDYEYNGKRDAVEICDNKNIVIIDEKNSEIVNDDDFKPVLDTCPMCGSNGIVQHKSCEKYCNNCGHKWGSCGD